MSRLIAIIYFNVAACFVPVVAYIIRQRIAEANAENCTGAEVELCRAIASICGHIVIAISYFYLIIAAEFKLHFVLILCTVVNFQTLAISFVAFFCRNCRVHEHSSQSHTKYSEKASANVDDNCIHM